jgi:hypothetical protein
MKIIFACALVTAGVALASAEQLARSMGDPNVSGGSANIPPGARSIGDYVAGYQATNLNDSKRDNFGRQTDINSYEHAEAMRERAESMREPREGVRGEFR